MCVRRLTEGGNAFPLDAPWGNTGITMNAVCMAALYHKLQGQSGVAKERAKLRGLRCFMHRQLGFLTNHKCDREHEACSTPGPAGFSYITGCAVAHVKPVLRRRIALSSNLDWAAVYM